jgi:hypothetical protein
MSNSKRGLIPDRGKKFISSPKRPEQLWVLPNHLFRVLPEMFS